MSDGQHPDLRASDADRERTADALRHATGDGQLSVEELEARVDQAYSARTRGELEALTADLQTSAPADDRAAGDGVTVRRGEGGARWLLAILGGCDRSGRWRLGARCTSLNVMGGSDLDLNRVELAADRVQLNVISIMGGSDIHVPDDLNVEVSQFALLGGNDVHLGDVRPPASGPVLHLRLISLMGGSSVTRGPKRSRQERRALRDERRLAREQRRAARREHRGEIDRG